MAYLEGKTVQTFQQILNMVNSFKQNPGAGAAKLIGENLQVVMSAGLRLLMEKFGDSYFGERAVGIGAGAADLTLRILQAGKARALDLPLYNKFPGYMAVYRQGALSQVIPFQFEAKVTSDARTAEFDTEAYGFNEISTYTKTSLRSITLETQYATLDPLVYSSHFVEARIRELQSLVYADTHYEGALDTSKLQSMNGMEVVPPPIVGLFIGDKFMRPRPSRLVYSGRELKVQDGSTGTDGKNLTIINRIAKAGREVIKSVTTMQPIYWKVDSVSVEWGESPINIDIEELDYNFIPGNSRLPMYQKVTIALKEHRSPNTFETSSDIASYNSINSIIGKTIM